MTFIQLTVIVATCLLSPPTVSECLVAARPAAVEGATTTPGPIFSGEALDVELSAASALVWDVASGEVLYTKDAYTRRPIASLSKLLSVLVIRHRLDPETVVAIPPVVRTVQRQGADIALPVGQHASVQELLGASLVASANDALVTLAVAASGSEESFVAEANQEARAWGLSDTQLATATGLSGGVQYSTAAEVRELLSRAWDDPILGPWLAEEKGIVITAEGTRKPFKTTNKLLGTYLPILAAKTGYTTEAGENLAIITRRPDGAQLGAVVLGSTQRFQDMKTLVEWVGRNYTWKQL